MTEKIENIGIVLIIILCAIGATVWTAFDIVKSCVVGGRAE